MNESTPIPDDTLPVGTPFALGQITRHATYCDENIATYANPHGVKRDSTTITILGGSTIDFPALIGEVGDQVIVAVVKPRKGES